MGPLNIEKRMDDAEKRYRLEAAKWIFYSEMITLFFLTESYPLELIPYILEPRKEMIHFISKQI